VIGLLRVQHIQQPGGFELHLDLLVSWMLAVSIGCRFAFPRYDRPAAWYLAKTPVRRCDLYIPSVDFQRHSVMRLVAIVRLEGEPQLCLLDS
jgi:hypothetical protein